MRARNRFVVAFRFISSVKAIRCPDMGNSRAILGIGNASRTAKGNGVLGEWSIGIEPSTITPILHHSITPTSLPPPSKLAAALKPPSLAAVEVQTPAIVTLGFLGYEALFTIRCKS